MDRAYMRQSPLAHLGLAARAAEVSGAVEMSERPFRALVNLRGDRTSKGFSDAVAKIVGMAPPTEANTFVTGEDGGFIVWLGPDEWLIHQGGDGPDLAQRLSRGMTRRRVGIVDVSESRTTIRIAGEKAAATLAKGCTIDLHPRVFGPGKSAQTIVAKANALLMQVDDRPTYDIVVLRSFSHYVWHWLADAAEEYGGITVVR